MKYICWITLLLSVLTTGQAKGQDVHRLDGITLDSVANVFIEKALDKGNDYTNGFKVFIVRFVETDSSMCFSFGYIMNKSELKIASKSRFYKDVLGRQVLLTGNVRDSVFPLKLGFKEIDEEIVNDLGNILKNDGGLNGFTYDPCGLIYCVGKGYSFVKYFESEIDIPRKFLIR